MNIEEIANFDLTDAVKFHKTLNPKLWEGTDMREEVRDQLLLIADDFLQELGIHELDVKDIVVSGSNAAYSYTKNSDLDLHILVDYDSFFDSDVYRELFNAKKNIYNETHAITIHGVPVELYVQDTNEKHISMGEYSVLKQQWISIPARKKPHVNEKSVQLKYAKLVDLIETVEQTKSSTKLTDVLKLIKRYRQTGLDKGGEFSSENLAFKLARANGYIDKLRKLKNELHSDELTIKEASGYIPSEKQKNDPRFKTALTVDIHPDSIQKNAKAFGSKITRAGIPPQANSNGKI